MCPNLPPEETEKNDEIEVKSTKADSETTGKKFFGEYSHTERYLNLATDMKIFELYFTI